MIPDDLVVLAKSYSTYDQRKAISDPRANTQVFLEVIKRINQNEVLREIFNSPKLNQEIVDAVYENKPNDPIALVLIINSNFFSPELFKKISDNQYNETILGELVKCKYADENLYIKILNSLNGCSYSLIRSICYILFNGPLISSSIINMMLEKYGNNKEVMSNNFLKKAIESPICDETILLNIIDIISKRNQYYDRTENKEIISTMLSSNKLSLNILMKIVEVFKNQIDYFDLLLACPLCTTDVIKKLPIENSGMFNKILNWDKLTPELLIYLLSQYDNYQYTIDDINKLLEKKEVNEAVLIAVVNAIAPVHVFSDYSYTLRKVVPGNKRPLVTKIINHPAMNSNVANAIMSAFKNNYAVQILLVDTNYITKDLMVEMYMSEERLILKDDIDKFFEINGLTTEDVIKATAFSFDFYFIKKAKDFDPSSKELNSSLLKSIYKGKKIGTEDAYNSVLVELITRNLTEDDLVYIVNNETRGSNIFNMAIEHPNAGFKVVDALLAVSEKITNETERKKFINQVDDLKRKTAAKIYKIEQEENVTDILKMNVEDGLSTMLWGPSGVGKSSRVLEVDPTATMLILKNGMLPEEVIGGKEPNGIPGEIYPPHWYVILCKKCQEEPDRMHILFIDEFTNVNDTIKNLAWEIIGARLVNGHEEWPLPSNCAIVVAGNRPEESSAVRIDANGGVMPAPLHNRIDSMLEIQFDIDEWQKWALETDSKTGQLRMHPIVYSFCVANADKVMFTNFDPENVTEPFLSPRKWETLSKAIYKAESRGQFNHISDARIISIIGDNEISKAFIAHYERLPIDMNRIKMGTYKESDFPKVDDKLYALGIIIANYEGDEVTIENFILECLGDEFLSIYKNMKATRRSVLESSKQDSSKLGR